MLRVLVVLASGLALCWSYPAYMQEIPNGMNVPDPCNPGATAHGVGHLNPSGGGARNQFGLDFAANGHVWTKALCELDSDSDGLTNGQELGDPDCTWQKGDADPTGSKISHPGINPSTDC